MARNTSVGETGLALSSCRQPTPRRIQKQKGSQYFYDASMKQALRGGFFLEELNFNKVDLKTNEEKKGYAVSDRSPSQSSCFAVD